MKTLVIIPAYNEEKCIEHVVNSLLERVQNVDVLVVNDGSRDNTSKEARKTNAKIIDLPFNLGIGGAVQTGYLYALKNEYDIAIQYDGDGQHRPEYIEKMINIMQSENCDLVIGSRFIEKTSYTQSAFRMLGIKIIRTVIKLCTGKKVYDPTSRL